MDEASSEGKGAAGPAGVACVGKGLAGPVAGTRVSELLSTLSRGRAESVESQ